MVVLFLKNAPADDGCIRHDHLMERVSNHWLLSASVQVTDASRKVHTREELDGTFGRDIHHLLLACPDLDPGDRGSRTNRRFDRIMLSTLWEDASGWCGGQIARAAQHCFINGKTGSVE